MNKRLSKSDSDRVEYLLRVFSQENGDIRNALSSLLPLYNELLGMHALSFEEFALLPAARRQGFNVQDPLFRFENVRPDCPKCGKENAGRRVAPNSYVCSACGFKFAGNWQSISSGSKCSSLTWLQVLHCMLEYKTIEETMAACKITATTFYRIRSRLFYAMMLFLADLKLYGHVQLDHTFVKASYKGTDLNDPNYPEDSPLKSPSFVPREAHVRGHEGKDRSIDQICILAAADDHGHVITRFVGFGTPNASSIQNALSPDRILLRVPAEDPVAAFLRPVSRMPSTSPGDNSLLISDGERAIAHFAKMYGIEHERHVYRRRGVQQKLPKGAHDIQLVNNIHSRLKRFLAKTSYVSSAYLPGFLVMFEWIENTGATPAAIEALFSILSRPGLGRPESFYKELFSVPSHLLQWASEDSPLRHFTQTQLLGFYLYHQRQQALEMGETLGVKTVAEIAELCGCSPSTVRRNYLNLQSAGFTDKILAYFAAGDPAQESFPGRKYRGPKPAQVSPLLRVIYDDCVKNRSLLPHERLSWQEFTEDVNRRYGTTYTHKSLHSKIDFHIRKGNLPTLSKLIHATPNNMPRPWEIENMKMRKELDALIAGYRRKGASVPPQKELLSILAEKHGVPVDRIKFMITHLPANYRQYDV